MNKVLLIGRLTKNPEFKVLNNGMKATNLSIAVNRRFKDKNGEWREATDFFDIETYGSTAERAAQLGKGYQVAIEGVLRQDKWTSPSGDKKSKVKIIANKVRLLSKPKTTVKTEKENLLEEEVSF
jgi:single-strand DNA-binding protein